MEEKWHSNNTDNNLLAAIKKDNQAEVARIAKEAPGRRARCEALGNLEAGDRQDAILRLALSCASEEVRKPAVGKLAAADRRNLLPALAARKLGPKYSLPLLIRIAEDRDREEKSVCKEAFRRIAAPAGRASIAEIVKICAGGFLFNNPLQTLLPLPGRLTGREYVAGAAPGAERNAGITAAGKPAGRQRLARAAPDTSCKVIRGAALPEITAKELLPPITARLGKEMERGADNPERNHFKDILPRICRNFYGPALKEQIMTCRGTVAGDGKRPYPPAGRFMVNRGGEG
ncbi:MAG: hypothetical protein LBC81_04465 [Tannerellaceae bacterium]|nr:hypothetical protein [Tannerellaceae bacterium]